MQKKTSLTILLAQKKNDWLNNVGWPALVEIIDFGHAMVLSSL
jgi:hypothetical protein